MSSNSNTSVLPPISQSNSINQQSCGTGNNATFDVLQNNQNSGNNLHSHFGGLNNMEESGQSSANRFSACSAPSSSTTFAPPPPNNEPIVIFTPCSNSHPFEERFIPVTRSEELIVYVKIGRAVARFQPANNNAIFDCKVLSRNHAILWYNGEHFFIKDTRSSNGTFVNNERLSNSGEESAPRALYSGDILQLGVEIVDNAKKVASGCVTCIVTLLDETGKEHHRLPGSSCPTIASLTANDGASDGAIAHNGGATGGGGGGATSIERLLLENEQLFLRYTLVPNNKLFVMDQYMKEARFKENALGLKLQLLEEQLAAAQEALETSWQALIKEEHLLSRIEILESQLAMYATTFKSINQQASGKGAKSKNNGNSVASDAQKSESNSGGAENCEKSENDKRENGETEDEKTISCDNNNAGSGSRGAKFRLANEDRIRGEMREIYEDRIKAELAAKDALRKAEEEVLESTMRFHDIENSLLNVESENALLRRRCEDYDAELQRQRTMLDDTLVEMSKARDASESQHSEELLKLQTKLDELQQQIGQKTAENERMAEILNNISKRERLRNEMEERAQVKSTEKGEKDDDNASNVIEAKDDDETSDVKDGQQNEKIDESEENQVSFDGECCDHSSSMSNEMTSSAVCNKNRCPCGGILTDKPPQEAITEASSSARIQVLLFSTLPFLLLLVALLFPLFNIWPRISTPTVKDVVANGSSNALTETSAEADKLIRSDTPDSAIGGE